MVILGFLLILFPEWDACTASIFQSWIISNIRPVQEETGPA